MVVGHTPQSERSKCTIFRRRCNQTNNIHAILLYCGSYAHLGAFSLSGKVIENLEAGAARQQQTQQR